MPEVYIHAAVRTPMGGMQGALAPLTAPELGATAIAEAISRAGVDGAQVDEVLMGCVLPAGQGQAPARQAALGAGLPQSVPAVTLNKMCGSGMQALMSASDSIRAGSARTIVAGGMESMTNAPYLLPKMRGGARLGHGQVMDSMFLDGLEDAYDKGRLMGSFAEDCAAEFQFSRQAQDEYALRSLTRAKAAIDEGRFADEVVAVKVATRGGETMVDTDEQPGNARPDKIPTLRPAFRKDGTVTAANSSSISDGAAALVLSDKAEGAIARIMGHAGHAQAPADFPTAPVPAAEKLLAKLGWAKEDVDLWEVNEAFAVVPMAFMQKMGLSPEVVNVNGGACAMGHPIGASGARIVVTLINALRRAGKKRGVAAICIGGGEGTAIAIELV
ncbi:thiolase family protein [Paracoccus alkenifer]|uniref:Acetyl-CoA C-acetyltransferase n=1 Tax=Paracoccus alkenifer TaxID=65735 RepID=A0A1H6MA82_9RHOB|nr:acetyl-CoA C-acyltransferase [Paracoccus alkenifer]SEH95899.1 acetyl-CoA C-acetyltransferase [Paracoccus alkenifer]